MARASRSKQPDNKAATGGPMDDTIRGSPKSRLAKADTKRAVEKATGPMSASKDIDPDLKLEMNRPPADVLDSAKKSRAAPKSKKPLDKGSARTGGVAPDTPVPARVTRSNEEIARDSTVAARKSPASRSARTEGGLAGEAARDPKSVKRAGATRRRAPAPGSATAVTTHQFLRGQRKPGSAE